MSPFTFSPLLILNNEHPITPPPELVQQWCSQLFGCDEKPEIAAYELARWAARWGADQELEACCHLLRQQGFDVVDDLRATRRPKPPSLKEQALEAAQRFYANGHEDCSDEEIKDDFDAIRRALESLPD